MVTAYDIEAGRLISAMKEELKKNEAVKPPEWAAFAKSGTSRERPPQQEDFWYIRGAALLRKIYTKGPIGVSRLKTAYGGKKNRGAKSEKHCAGAGKIIRLLLQQLEAAGFIQKTRDGGRKISSKGHSFVDNIAFTLSKEVQLGEAKRAVDAKHQFAPKPKPKEGVKEKPPVEKKEEAPKGEAKPAEKKETPKGEVKAEKKEEKTEAPKKEKPEEAPKEKPKEEVKEEKPAPKEEKAPKAKKEGKPKAGKKK